MTAPSEIPYSSALASKGALLEETIAILAQIDAGHSIAQTRALVVTQNLLGKETHHTRATIWDRLHRRYLTDQQRAHILARMITRTPDRHTRKLVLFYEMCQVLPLLRDTTLQCVYPRYTEGYSGISPRDVQNYFDHSAAQHPELEKWTPQTRAKVVSNILTILRDCGLLTGTQHKHFARVYVPLPVFVYCLYSLSEAGVGDPYSLLKAPDWQLFFLERADVIVLLDEATAAGHCTFKHQGNIYSLDLAYPSWEVCVETLITEV